MGASSTETEFSALQFEKTLTALKNSQESINQCCQWCLSNRQHYKKIVSCWLNVIKRVKIEHRLTLFYLANDVVQYSKRKNYEYIETWGTAIQKATTLVRDEKIKHKILRIFKIWEQRSVYGEDFIADLCGLISIQPTGSKTDEPHEFQASYVINKIKTCSSLEKDTDTKLKMLKEHNPKIQISEGLINSLKDRAHVDDVEKEVEVYVDHMESYVNALKLEIKNRISLISVLKQSLSQLESDRRDVKTVAHAYKTFGQRVKLVQKKLDEHMESLPSPLPSPDINAPSPSPEEDIELPEDNTTIKISSEDNSIDLSSIQYTNPGYYVPPPTTSSNAASSASYSTSYNSTNHNSTVINNTSADTSSNFLSNSFTSFLGQNLSFDISNISAGGLFNSSGNEISTVDNTQTTNSYVTTPTPVARPPAPVASPPIVDLTMNDIDNTVPYNPLLPPPMPPFSKNSDAGFSFNSSLDISTTSTYDPRYTTSYSESNYSKEGSSVPNSSHYDYPVQSAPYPLTTEETYDPTQVTESWDELEDPQWNEVTNTDTPESPPLFEKEGYGDPVEYHDSNMRSGAVDVDQRVIPGMGDLEDSLGSLGGKDIDHRNLISLTGSPSVESPVNENGHPTPLPARGNLKTITPQETLWETLDQDYRNLSKSDFQSTNPPSQPTAAQDQDYRLQFNLDIPPPPPSPPKSPGKKRKKPPPPPPLPAPGAPGDPRLRCIQQITRKEDIVGDVDMDLSDDIDPPVELLDREARMSLEPPPPLPDLLDDVDANQFLDEISDELNKFSNLSADFNIPEESNENQAESDSSVTNAIFDEKSNEAVSQNVWPPLQPPPMGFSIGEFSPGMCFTQGMSEPAPVGGFMPPINTVSIPNHPRPGLLPPPFPAWNGPNEMSSYMPDEENPYLNDENDIEEQTYVGFRNQRGGLNNFRGGFDFDFNRGGFTGGFRGRGRGRGNSPWVDRGRGRGNRGGRGMGSPFRPRGFRGRGR